MLFGIPFLHDAITKLFLPHTADDAVDRINYLITPTLLVFFALTVSAKQYVGTPIQCWMPFEFKKAWKEYAEDYCFIQNTYFVGDDEAIPMSITERNQRQFGYYQWVPVVLALQAVFFYLPNFIWKTAIGWKNRGHVDLETAITEACSLRQMRGEKRKIEMCKLVQYMIETLGLQRAQHFDRCKMLSGISVSTLYLLVKLLYVMNVIGQFLILNAFIGRGYGVWGWTALESLWSGTEWHDSPVFPRVSFCDFEIRHPGNTHRYTVQCVLMINMFNEKIYLLIWYWFFTLALCTLVNFICTLCSLFPLPARKKQLRNLLLPHQSATSENLIESEHFDRFATGVLRPDGVLLLRFIERHAGAIVARELTSQLFVEFVKKQEQLKQSFIKMSLSRFQLSNDAADVADSKNLSVVLAFNVTGVFNVMFKVEDFKYSVYYACPLRPKGRPCGRKLSDDKTCSGCGVKTKEPLQNLLVRLVLQDIEQPQILQQATMFSATAERFWGLKAAQLSGNSTAGLDTILTNQLEEKLGLELNVKINIKEWPSGDDLRPREEQIGGGPEGLERQEADVGNDKEPIFRESSHHVHRIERFALSRYVTECTLNANSEEPDETLRNAFDQLINRAIQNAESGGRKVAKLGIWLMGKDVLMAELEKLGQSDADEERDGGMDKRTLLLSEPIQIIVTCLTPPTGAAPRFHPYQNWGYGDRHRIKICNTDDNWSLEQLLNDRLRLRELAEELVKDAEIPDDLDAYGMEHLDQDRVKPGLYRIVLFDDTPEVYHSNDSGCFIQKVAVPEDKPRYRIVCWDTETRLEQLAG
ncbi:hypothetical protein GPALN_010772 [Globodera pallida]|nr:hypothetical protein GPALN_010772 [Globodera pallida]